MKIDGVTYAAGPGATILTIAESNGIEIPHLCSEEEIEPYNSCMICLVETNGTLVPACSYPADRAGDVTTANTRIHAARARALELLLTEHRGDCEAPCTRGCPAGLDIPEMIRLIESEDVAGALTLARSAVVLPGVMGRICNAPCERVCRRSGYDAPIAIRQLESFVAEAGLGTAGPTGSAPPVGRLGVSRSSSLGAQRRPDSAAPAGTHAGAPQRFNDGAPAGERGVAAHPERAKAADVPPHVNPSAGMKTISVAIIGAGPSGLSAAAFSAAAGHRVTVFDNGELPGGALRTGVGNDRLPEQVLDSDIESVAGLGVVFNMKCEVGKDVSIEELVSRFDTVVVTAAIEERDSDPPRDNPGVVYANRARTGSRASRQAIVAVRNGRAAARAALQSAGGARSKTRQFDSRYGALTQDELDHFVVTSGADTKRREESVIARTSEDAAGEVKRCLSCDCNAKQSCRLREYAAQYVSRSRSYRGVERPPFSRSVGKSGVVYEESKCIRCGLCVRITAAEGISPGFGFRGRGHTMRVRPPFGEDPGEALGKAAKRCVAACPTGALSFGVASAQEMARGSRAPGGERQ